MSKNKSTFIHKTYSDEDIEAYFPRLNVNDTISMKMKRLCEISVLSICDINSRKRMLDYLHSLFQPFYPDCQLIAFGSSINGFGTKGCDLDLMFSPSYSEHLDISETDDGYLPTTLDARKNPYVKAQLKNMSKERQLRFLLRILRRDKDNVKGAMYIPAKCPIVRFFVSFDEGLRCDLSFHHGLPKCNSELLNYISTLNDCIKPLMITLRLWAKHLKIINTGGFSSYSFSLLVIFFLQNTKESVIPPLNHLMLNAESRIVDGWETGFRTDLPAEFISNNTLSEEELLKEFFKFYWNFDFARNVVCIRTGKTMPVSDIRKATDERIEQFVISDVCIQDPFNLSHNVSSSVTLPRLHLLKPYFFIANLILSKNPKSLDCENIFKLLFDSELYKNMMQEHFFFCELDVFESFYMYANFEIIAAFAYNFENLWFEQASQAVRDVLDYIFLFNCEVIDKDYSLKNTNFGNGYSESEQNCGKLLLSIQCGVDNRVWKYRNAKKDVPLDSYSQNFTNEVLKKENALSHFLLASNPALQSLEPFIWFLCNIHQSKYSQIPYIWITLIPLGGSSEFKSLSKVLKGFIPQIVQKMLLNRCI